MQLIKPGTQFDFTGKRRFFGTLSAFLVALSVALFVFVGPNWGIDFTGGTEIHLKFDEPIDISEIRTSLAEIGLSQDAVQQINQPKDYEFIIRIREATFGADEMQAEVTQALTSRFGDEWIVDSRFAVQVGARMTIEYVEPKIPLRTINSALDGMEGVSVQESPDDRTFYVKLQGLSSRVKRQISDTLTEKSFTVMAVDTVGPKVGGDLRQASLIAMFATLGLVLVYIGFRFDLSFAPGAIIALIHDVALTMGLFVVFQREVNTPMIGALLTIIGYSLNDTIVIYDRIRENMQKYRRSDLEVLINDSINETLARTFATSLTTLMAVSAFLFLGGPTIQTFALAMMIGVVVGTYSTIFVATPMILVMEKVKPLISKLLVPANIDDDDDDLNAA
jgi:preprotein translocase subunit SecF